MFKIKGFCLFALLALFHCQTVFPAQNTTPPQCYAAEDEVTDTTIRCCDGLQRMHEVGTGKVFCDQPPSAGSAVYMWIIILFFPMLLLVFAIFGIRNKMARNRNTTTHEKP